MHDDITDVTGITVGHADDQAVLTGCTVVLATGGAVVGVDVRGLAPGTRETDLCRPGTLVERAHAVLLSGGSALGLDAASGVMRFLWERNIGFDTGFARIPIVPGAVIFDLGIGEIGWPDAEMGYRACAEATSSKIPQGGVGAGAGATVGKILGPQRAMKSGLGSASISAAGMMVGALVVVNAFGDIVSDDGRIVAGARNEDGSFAGTEGILLERPQYPIPASCTTIGVVATDAALTPEEASHIASIAHDGLARAIRPVHTKFDGDTMFALATGTAAALDPRISMTLDVAVTETVERAVVRAVLEA